MKNWFLVGVFALLGIFTLAACSRDDAPADNDVFVGTYKGKITYKKEGETKKSDNGSVTVVKTGNSYYFRFSDGIEDLTGVQFKKESETLVNLDFQDGVQYIKVTASKLNILYMKDGKVWTAQAER